MPLQSVILQVQSALTNLGLLALKVASVLAEQQKPPAAQAKKSTTCW